ncbi:MAG: hypothetical protein ABIH39_02280, partial [Candidatus Margulisiibacteriota bacterium]
MQRGCFKTALIVFLLIAVSTICWGMVTPYSKIDQAQTSGEIDDTTALINRFYSVVDRGRVPARLSTMETAYIKCGTQIMLEVQEKWASLPEDFKQSFKRYFPEQLTVQSTYSSTHFNINWGDNLTVSADADVDGVPDIAELWAEYFETTYAKEVSEMGFNEPSNMGGNRYNIYIGGTWTDSHYPIESNAYGYMMPS